MKKNMVKTGMFQENSENIDMFILEHVQLWWQVENENI